MCWVYILQSEKNSRYYIGSTNDMERRLAEHNSGKTKSLEYLLPLKLVFKKEFKTTTEARRVETKLKKFKSRIILEQIVKDQEIKSLQKGPIV